MRKDLRLARCIALVLCITTWLVVMLVAIAVCGAQSQCAPGQPCRPSTQDWRPVRPQLPAPVYRWDPGVPLAPRVKSSGLLPNRVFNPAVVRVWSKDEKGEVGYGTGTIFRRHSEYAYILTAAHVVRDSKDVSVNIRSTWHSVTIKHVDNVWDVAILTIADPHITPIQLAEKLPIKGESIKLSGFGKTGVYSYGTGKLTGFVSPGSRNLPFEWMEVSVGSRLGDSGGPIVNTRGRLVGIISGTRPGETVGCCLPRLRAIIRGVLPPWPNRPGVVIPKPRLVTPLPQQVPSPLPVPSPPSVTTAILDYNELAAALDYSELVIDYNKLAAAIDYDKLATAILKQIDLSTLQGPQGIQGKQGKQGVQGIPGSVSQSTSTGSMIIKVEPITSTSER